MPSRRRSSDCRKWPDVVTPSRISARVGPSRIWARREQESSKGCTLIDERNQSPGVRHVIAIGLTKRRDEHLLFRGDAIEVRGDHQSGDDDRHDPVRGTETRADEERHDTGVAGVADDAVRTVTND